ncbi:MAG: hypothetical protein LC104_09160 [Bacteroidales bacterium]|nr:hypothetical protein [Bacteroidales bacterium]
MSLRLIALTGCVWSVAIATLLAADRPGTIIIRPGGSSAGGVAPAPDRPGFIVIRPQTPGQTSPPRETFLQEQPAAPTPQPATAPATTSQPVQTAPAAQPAQATPEEGRVVLETWDTASIRGQKIGYFHVIVREYERDGKKYLYATKTQRLTIARFGERVQLWAEDATLELPDGTVLTTRMRQGLGRDQKLALTGEVHGDKLRVKIEGAAGGEQEVPWPTGVVGIAREATLIPDRKPKMGEKLDYLYYEGRLNRVVKILVTTHGEEEITLAPHEKPRKVLRIEQGMEPIGNFRLPPSTLYCDPISYQPLKSETDVPMLGGRLTVVRTTKEIALRPIGDVPDMFNVQSIRLDQEVPRIHNLAAVVYKITSNGEVPANKLFPTTDRQSVKSSDPSGKSIELTIAAMPLTAADPNAPADPGKEFREPSFFIDWDNDTVKRHAAAAVAGLPRDADTLRKALAVESWVHRNMRAIEFSQAMATCSNVARTLSGDCTEYAMLSVGICRALGIPARTALGLVYAPVPGSKPCLAYHMWFEVYVDGRWIPMDATLGYGGIGPGHVKITDASWHEERSFAPLLPVLTVLTASPKFEVIRFAERNR